MFLLEIKEICNSLSVTYKLLLEKANIYSMCVRVKDHMINLVRNDNGTFSFDDIMKAIMKRDFTNNNIKIKNQYFLNKIKPIRNIYDYFNYSYSKALKLRQGFESFNDKYTNKMIYWLPMSTIDYTYKLIKKKLRLFKSYKWDK